VTRDRRDDLEDDLREEPGLQALARGLSTKNMVAEGSIRQNRRFNWNSDEVESPVTNGVHGQTSLTGLRLIAVDAVREGSRTSNETRKVSERWQLTTTPHLERVGSC